MLSKEGASQILTLPATAIHDRFLHHAEIIKITGRSYRLKDRATGKTDMDN
ncbi:MAG: ATP-binding protein [Kiritimatiellae bacterium]|nr:ATP-binding protein [Kiritimatiellia bacterium]